MVNDSRCIVVFIVWLGLRHCCCYEVLHSIKKEGLCIGWLALIETIKTNLSILTKQLAWKHRRLWKKRFVLSFFLFLSVPPLIDQFNSRDVCVIRTKFDYLFILQVA